MKDLIFFSGSGARIASHLGAAQALQDKYIVAKEYGGISGGAIIATFAAMGIIEEVREEILTSTPGKVFFPPVFNAKGNVRAFQGLLGYALHGPRAFASLEPLRIRLKGLQVARKAWEHRLPLFTYLYHRGEGLVKRKAFMRDWEEWVDILILSSSIPGLIDGGDYSDAGILRQLPLDSEKGSDWLCFTTAPEHESPYLLDDILRRVAIDNREDELESLSIFRPKMQSIPLPSSNRTTQYNPDLMRESYELSYKYVRNGE